ncbi:fe2+ transport protein [Halobacteriales archaeon QS_1_67_19]|nr:MAG: fe2+ transport protein [Halobacteriales archaeon QS_1_67_19]
MNRRTFLALGTGLAVGARPVAATHGAPYRREQDRQIPARQQTTVEDKPDGVYVQPFLETMSMQGTTEVGDYKVAVMYTIPHRFWTMTGTERAEQPLPGDASVHLMAQVWDPETGTVLPEVGLSVEITRDGDLVSEEVIYPMLSQRMGFHYGANFTLAGDGEYTVTLSIGGMQIRRTGAFEGRFGEAATAEIGLTYTEETRGEVQVREIDQAGQRGALKPMDMEMVPVGLAPASDDLPRTVVGTAESDDARFVVSRVPADEADRFTDGEPYLLVSARTPYNDLLLPMMGLEATVTRDGETVFDGRLERTLDSEVNYHYGTAVEGGLRSGDAIALSVAVPPQVARHQGYETAFLEMPETEL